MNPVMALLQVKIFAAVPFSLVNTLERRFAPWTWMAMPILT